MHKIINRIKEKKASKRFDVEIPEFNVKDCLKEEGIKIRVKNSEEKYLDVIFKVSTKFSSDPDGYGEDLESFAASFSDIWRNFAINASTLCASVFSGSPSFLG